MKDTSLVPINRRKFVGSLGIIGVLTGLNPIDALAKSQTNEAAEELVMKCKPYLQVAKTDGMIIKWITSVPCHSWVEYGENPSDMNLKAQQIEDGMVQVNNTVHTIELKNLNPGKTYYYKVFSENVSNLKWKQISFGDKINSEVYSFNTIADEIKEVNFLVFNDIHDRPESFSKLMQFDDRKKKDFVFLNGDMFNSTDDENQVIEHLIDPLTALFAAHTPFVFGRGNHETHGVHARKITDYFDGEGHPFYYSMNYGPMWAIVLDSGDARPDEDPVTGGIADFDHYRIEQAKWLEKEIEKEEFKKAKYKVVFIHIPPYYSADIIHSAEQYKPIWGPLLDKAKVDLMICGHTHKHGIHPVAEGKNSYPIVIGGGPTDGKRTIINVKVTENALNLTMTNDLGLVVGTLNL